MLAQSKRHEAHFKLHGPRLTDTKQMEQSLLAGNA
jgi:hypothetical protein